MNRRRGVLCVSYLSLSASCPCRSRKATVRCRGLSYPGHPDNPGHPASDTYTARAENPSLSWPSCSSWPSCFRHLHPPRRESLFILAILRILAILLQTPTPAVQRIPLYPGHPEHPGHPASDMPNPRAAFTVRHSAAVHQTDPLYS